jgi:hypothetical protein
MRRFLLALLIFLPSCSTFSGTCLLQPVGVDQDRGIMKALVHCEAAK